LEFDNKIVDGDEKIELEDINSSFSAVKENRNLFTRLFRRK